VTKYSSTFQSGGTQRGRDLARGTGATPRNTGDKLRMQEPIRGRIGAKQEETGNRGQCLTKGVPEDTGVKGGIQDSHQGKPESTPEDTGVKGRYSTPTKGSQRQHQRKQESRGDTGFPPREFQGNTRGSRIQRGIQDSHQGKPGATSEDPGVKVRYRTPTKGSQGQRQRIQESRGDTGLSLREFQGNTRGYRSQGGIQDSHHGKLGATSEDPGVKGKQDYHQGKPEAAQEDTGVKGGIQDFHQGKPEAMSEDTRVKGGYRTPTKGSQGQSQRKQESRGDTELPPREARGNVRGYRIKGGIQDFYQGKAEATSVETEVNWV
jgi:hypothetical protein